MFTNCYNQTTVTNIPSGEENGYEYVDLGLSVKWAMCNIGSKTIEDPGWLFAWGETMPKISYVWESYSFYEITKATLSKYCTDSLYGNVDWRIDLEPEDDAARTNWGGDWRMPTYEELNELCINCTWRWSELNKVKGYIITGPNGNSIFLPAAGILQDFDEQPKNVGVYGVYWSNSLNKDEPCFAGNLDTYKDNHYAGKRIYRFSGLSVRAVIRQE
jgi:hypothetical protein